MSCREDDESQLLRAYTTWLYNRGDLEPFDEDATLNSLVGEYLKDRKAERTWGKQIEKQSEGEG